MHKNFLLGGLLVLAFLGIADSSYLAYTALSGSKLVCSIKGLDGCNVVAQSIYSHLFGIPLGLYGVVFYSLLFILAALVIIVPRRFAHDALAALGILGFIASVFFMLIQVFLIKAVCVYCLGSAIISLFACILSVLVWKKFTNTQSTSKKPAVVTIPPL
jgi:uncharacterized membrane protein